MAVLTRREPLAGEGARYQRSSGRLAPRRVPALLVFVEAVA